LMQWVHSRLHQVPVIWIHSVERRRKGAVAATGAGGEARATSWARTVYARPVPVT
jgi:hypothetical protein